MNKSGKFKLNESTNLKNKSSIVINHEQIRLTSTIKNLETLLLQRENEILNINEDKKSLDRQLSLLGNRYTEIVEKTKILNNRNNRETSLATRYKLDLEKVQVNLDKCKELIIIKKEEIKQLKTDKKVLFDEKADILITKKELTDSNKIILRSSVMERMKVKKQVILPSILKNFQKEINKILNEFQSYNNYWLNIFTNDWKGTRSNIFSLSGNRSIEILKKFGYTQNFQKNGIPFKKITEPSNGWVLSDTKSIDYLVKDYICFSNILPKSCPGCDDFVLDKNIDISLKTLFDAVNTCIPGKSINNSENQQLIINSSYNNYKYWSNCKEIIDKCKLCSNNIVYLNNKLTKINKLNDHISSSFDDIDDILQDYLLIENDQEKMKILWKELLDKVSIIYDLILNEFFELNKYDYNRDNIFIQVDCVSKIDKLNVIQWIRQVPLVYNNPITGPLVFHTNKSPEYNPIEYLIANKSGVLGELPETYQLAGDLGNIFNTQPDSINLKCSQIKQLNEFIQDGCDDYIKTLFNKIFINFENILNNCDGPDIDKDIELIYKQDTNVPINDRWEIIKTSEELQDDIINLQEESNIVNINLYFKNIIDLNSKLHSLFICELDNLNL